MKFLIVIQTIFAVLLVFTVLMHAAKAEGIGAIGGNAHMFGGQKDLEKGLDKFTAFLGGGFVLISLIIAIIS